jgi:hypothetical protein
MIWTNTVPWLRFLQLQLTRCHDCLVLIFNCYLMTWARMTSWLSVTTWLWLIWRHEYLVPYDLGSHDPWLWLMITWYSWLPINPSLGLMVSWLPDTPWLGLMLTWYSMTWPHDYLVLRDLASWLPGTPWLGLIIVWYSETWPHDYLVLRDLAS